MVIWILLSYNHIWGGGVIKISSLIKKEEKSVKIEPLFVM